MEKNKFNYMKIVIQNRKTSMVISFAIEVFSFLEYLFRILFLEISVC